MANKRILLDKSEMVLMVPGKKKMETYNLNSSQITRIQFDPCVERTFVIIPSKSEKITIVTPKRSQPIVYTKHQNKAFFEQYKTELAEYAKTYRVTFADNTKG